MRGRWSCLGTRRQMCGRKIRYTEPEATLICDRMDGYDAYPCPFSAQQYHWHVSRHGAHAGGADPFWWSHVQHAAQQAGGLGYCAVCDEMEAARPLFCPNGGRCDC